MIATAVRLADVLARENKALASMELAQAASLLAEKTEAIDAFAAAQAASPRTAPNLGGQRADAADLLKRLGELAAENRRLLDRAIAVQGRMIGLIARALPAAAAQAAPRYGAQGSLFRERSLPAVAISASA